jgi:hypothetical protein
VGSVKNGSGGWTIEKLAGLALVCATIFEAWIEFLFTTLETRHTVRETHFDEMALAYFLAGECSEEVHEIPFMIPLFHSSILAVQEGRFCVSWVTIKRNDVSPVDQLIFDDLKAKGLID